MEPSDGTGLPPVEHSSPQVPPDRLAYLEARVQALEKRIPATHLQYVVVGVIVFFAVLAVVLPLAVFGFGIMPFFGPFGPDFGGEGAAAVPDGPRLSNVASLPVDASGKGTIQGAPTGEAQSDDSMASFVLVLYPAPAGLPARTTLDVEFDHSTKVYRGTRLVGDPLDAINTDQGPSAADPSAVGSVVVQFHIRDGAVFADRIDLSDDFPPGLEP